MGAIPAERALEVAESNFDLGGHDVFTRAIRAGQEGAAVALVGLREAAGDMLRTPHG
jgi:hypothetical protein